MPEARNPALELIEEEFPADYQKHVGPALRRAYSAATTVIESTAFLSTPSGRLQRGDLILKATEFEFVRLILAGKLPTCIPAWEDYAIPTGKHLVMRTAKARITISQVPTLNSNPRSAVFRTNFGASNARYLFEEMNKAEEAEDVRRHLVVLHGYQELTHAAIAMPHPTENKLIARTENLLDLGGEDFGHLPPEGPTEPPDLEVIEELVRIVRDSK